MNVSLMKNYIDYLKNLVNDTPKMIVYDSFRGHLEESVKKSFVINGFDLAVIPAGLTSLCQPLDITINKPFKDYLRKEWHLCVDDRRWSWNNCSGQSSSR